MVGELSRRDFLAAALASGVVAALPVSLTSCSSPPTTSGDTELAREGVFIKDVGGHPRRSTCTALCERIVPTGADPRTDPGATEARAVEFIDTYLSAFELPSGTANGPAIWLRGRYSGREPFPDNADGTPSVRYPPSDFVEGGERRFLHLTRLQALSWRATLYGKGALDAAGVSRRWLHQVGGLIPAPTVLPMRDMYLEGLDAFDSYSNAVLGSPAARAGPDGADKLLAAASGTSTGLPSPPEAATALFPNLVVHTFQACYSLPEYAGNHGEAMWRLIGWDGDTQPLGNSIYDRSLAGPGEGPNDGFGDPAVFQPRGGYREHRAVSGPDATVRER